MIDIFHWFLHVSGSDNVSGKWYGFWSGFGGDLSLFTAVGVYLRHKNCHQKGCPRLGRHPHEGTPYVYCRKHHPDIP